MRQASWLLLLLCACQTPGEVIDTGEQANLARDGAGHALCAAGGPVAGDGVSGVMCLSPLDVTGHRASNGTTTWHPGPIGRIDP